MKNTVDPGSYDSAFHKPCDNPRPEDCLEGALELTDYKVCLKEQETTRNIDIASRRSQSICCGGTLLSGLCHGSLQGIPM